MSHFHPYYDVSILQHLTLILTLIFVFSEHSQAGRLRPAQDPGHRVFWSGHASATQREQDLLCHEDPG